MLFNQFSDMSKSLVIFIIGLVAVIAYPHDPIIRKLDPGLRYQYMRGPDGTPHLVDLWGKASDLAETARYDPDRENVYHLFTRQNPTVSQPLIIGRDGLLGDTNYDPNKRTVVLVHGWRNTITGYFNRVMIPAFLAADDVNLIGVDWSAGAINNYVVAVGNTVTSGEGVARFILRLNEVTGSSLSMYHLVGHSLGGHQVGIIGRNLEGKVAYITSLDPAFPGWITNSYKFRPSDGVYTEVMHTNIGMRGYLSPLGDVDFYPNGGIGMPGCPNYDCDHDRCFYYMAESLISGGFTGRRCSSYLAAITANCSLQGNLPMGGLQPKTGQSGIFYLATNASPPFSRG